MTKPKKWFLDNTGSGVVVKAADGECIKKPNAKQGLGRIIKALVPDEDVLRKLSPSEAILFECETGRIILAINNHDCSKGYSTMFMGIVSSYDLVAKWNELEESHSIDLPLESTPSIATPSTLSKTTTTPRRTGATTVASRGVLTCDQPSPSKKRKYMTDVLDEAIERSKKGMMELPTCQLFQPPKETRLLREADATFISHLKKRMLADPSAPGVCPMAVLCKDMTNPSEFQSKYKDVYEYEVLGGLHSLLCKNQLSSEYPDNPYFKVAVADVYVGLSDEQALRLARRHNDNSHFVHKVTHRDLVEACRARLYALNVLNLCQETPKPTPTWKDSCLKAIIPKDVSHTHRDNIFAQAAMSKSAWHLATQVMDLYEQAKLKGQKLRLATLLHKPEFKQNYLSPIRSLSVSEQCSLLQRVVDLELSLSDMQTEANVVKQRSALQVAFQKLTNVQSWEEAQERFPHFTTAEQLNRFMHIDLKKNIPKTFSDFCHRAKNSDERMCFSGSSSSIAVRGVTANVVVSMPTEISGSLLRQVDATFNGASLVLSSFSDSASKELMENVAYTIKEVNSFFGCHQFVAAAVSSIDNFQQVSSIWQRAFGKSELLFVADTSRSKASTTTYLTPCVRVVVLGFFSPSSDVCKELLNYPPSDSRRNFIEANDTRMYEHLISHFSTFGSIILDMTGLKEQVPDIALVVDRSIITVVASKEEEAAVLQKLSVHQSGRQ